MRTTGCGYMAVTRILAFLGLFIRCLCMAQAISHTDLDRDGLQDQPDLQMFGAQRLFVDLETTLV